MSNRSPAYVQTQLPVLLDLQNRNTRSQIDSGDGRAPAWSGGARGSVRQQSLADCRAIMEKSLDDWLEQKFTSLSPSNVGSAGGDIPRTFSREQDIKFFWEWVREFHNEYNDDWFSRNMPRLKTEFTPIWRKAVRAAASKGTASEDLLSYGDGTASRDVAGGQDLLGLDDGNAPPAPTGGSNSAPNGGADVMDLFGDGGVTTSSSAGTAQPTSKNTPVHDLLSLGGGAPPVPTTTSTQAAPVAPAATDDLLSLNDPAPQTQTRSDLYDFAGLKASPATGGPTTNGFGAPNTAPPRGGSAAPARGSSDLDDLLNLNSTGSSTMTSGHAKGTNNAGVSLAKTSGGASSGLDPDLADLMSGVSLDDKGTKSPSASRSLDGGQGASLSTGRDPFADLLM